MTRLQPHYESSPNERGPHVEFEAKTPDEAVELALLNLDMTRDEVVVTVLEKGSRGFLGLGARRARVRVEPKTQVASTVRALTSEVLRLMQVEGSVTAKQQGRNISVRIKTEETDGLLIGRKGETLNALQHLLSRMTARQTGLGDQARVMVDVAGYRSRREAQLRRSAQD
ncbi:MAG: KH domain-containing protein, partial [Candidatus Eisenbacteria bacterium]|nr:KH domain-containing protein [Candidatus Eisenbacteria bacterium]